MNRNIDILKIAESIVPWGFSIYLIVLSENSTYQNHQFLFQERNLYIIGAIFLALFPFFQHIRIGNILELRKSVKEAKAETQQYRSENQNLLSIISTNINNFSVGNNASATINFLSTHAKDSLNQFATNKNVSSIPLENEKPIIDNQKNKFELAQIRMKIEFLLKSMVNLIVDDTNKDLNYFKGKRPISLFKLFDLFTEYYPEYNQLRSSVKFVISISNYVVHSEHAPLNSIDEATIAGNKLIDIFNQKFEELK